MMHTNCNCDTRAPAPTWLCHALQATHAGSDVFSRQIVVPPPPARARFVGESPGEFPSRVPNTEADMLTSLEYTDRQRLLKERADAAAMDREHAEVSLLSLYSWLKTAYFQGCFRVLSGLEITSCIDSRNHCCAGRGSSCNCKATTSVLPAAPPRTHHFQSQNQCSAFTGAAFRSGIDASLCIWLL